MAAIDRLNTHLDKAWDDESNRLFHIREARDLARELRKYVRSIEDANAAMMQEIRNSRAD